MSRWIGLTQAARSIGRRMTDYKLIVDEGTVPVHWRPGRGANLAERIGADIELVRQGIGSDPRIGTQFLYLGCGYGRSCFPKDVKALMHTGEQAGMPLRMLGAVEAVNELQSVLVDKVVARFGEDLTGRRFAVMGAGFQAGHRRHARGAEHRGDQRAHRT